MSFLRAAGLVAVALVGLGCGGASRATIRVAAASSLVDVLDELAARWVKAGGGAVLTSTTSSSTAARQILDGAPADLFLSADPVWADAVAEAGLVAEGGRTTLLGNRLVVVVPADSELPFADLRDLARAGRVATGDPDHVPAGRYARAALKHAGVHGDLTGKIVAADSARVALAYVERGEVDAGIVYATDARASSRVRVAFDVPEDTHPPIRYPLLLLRDASSEARAFRDFLRGPEARAVFEAAGFRVLAD